MPLTWNFDEIGRPLDEDLVRELGVVHDDDGDRSERQPRDAGVRLEGPPEEPEAVIAERDEATGDAPLGDARDRSHHGRKDTSAPGGDGRCEGGCGDACGGHVGRPERGAASALP